MAYLGNLIRNCPFCPTWKTPGRYAWRHVSMYSFISLHQCPHCLHLYMVGMNNSKGVSGSKKRPMTKKERQPAVDKPPMNQAQRFILITGVLHPGQSATRSIFLPPFFLHYTNNRRQVTGPTIPSTEIFSFFWNALTAASVFGPKIPSTATPSAHCTRFTQVPRLPRLSSTPG